MTLMPGKKRVLQNVRKRQLYIRTQVAVKTKTFPILTSNETVIIPETQRNSDFLEPPGELMKIAFKNRTVREITVFDRREGKTEGSRNQDPTAPQKHKSWQKPFLVILCFHPFVTNGNNIVNFHGTHLIYI